MHQHNKRQKMCGFQTMLDIKGSEVEVWIMFITQWKEESDPLSLSLSLFRNQDVRLLCCVCRCTKSRESLENDVN